MKVAECNRIGPFHDVDITEVFFNGPILHLYFVGGARKALGVKFDGISFPLLAMLWVRFAYAFVQPGDPVLDQHHKLYHRALKKLVKAYDSLETLKTKLWGKNQPWIVDPAAPAENQWQ